MMFRVFSNKTIKYEQATFLPEKRWINPPRIVFISFFVAILIGSALLSLPWAVPNGKPSLKYIDALFTSASATCVTGLIVKDTPNDFSLFGQIVILSLIQIGGLGIMTMATFFLLLFGRRVTFKDTASVETSLGRSGFTNFRFFIKYVLLLTFSMEIIGALILFLRLSNSTSNNLTIGKTIYIAIFHSISAFCNAGFSLYSSSFIGYNNDPVIILTIIALIIAGGLGFVVIYNLLRLKIWKKDRIERGRLSLHSKVVLTGTCILIFIGFISFLIFEWENTMADMPIGQKLLNSLFCSITPRTAGFNTVDYANISKPSTLITMFLMFIGASPGSTGGGIKTATFVVLLMTSWSMVKGSNSVSLFRRTIPMRVVQESIGILSLSIFVVIIMSVILSITERTSDFGYGTKDIGSLTKIVFEVISAFGTVGLSTGITPLLSNLGKIVITFTMFIGRIGPLVAALAIAQREVPPEVSYPEERLIVG